QDGADARACVEGGIKLRGGRLEETVVEDLIGRCAVAPRAGRKRLPAPNRITGRSAQELAQSPRIDDAQAAPPTLLIGDAQQGRALLIAKRVERHAHQADAAPVSRVEEGGRLDARSVIQHALDAEL